MSTVDKGSQAAAWDANFSKLKQLRKGWNGYEAPPPSEQAMLTAKTFLEILLRENYEPNRLAPSAVGGIGITHRRGEKKVYVEFYNDGKVLALFSDDDSEPIIKGVEPSTEAFEGLIAEMRDYLDA